MFFSRALARLVLLTALLAVAGCNLNHAELPTDVLTVAPTPAAMPLPQETITPMATVHPALTETFIDNIAGITFNYPQGWSISGGNNAEAVAYAITLASFDLETAPGIDGIPAGASKYDIYVMPTGEFTSARDMHQRYTSRAGREELAALFVDEAHPLRDGTPGYYLRILDSFGQEWEILLTFINERGIEVAAVSSSAYFEEIIASLRPLDP